MTTPVVTPERLPVPDSRPWSARRTVLVVVGSVAAIIGGSLLIGGGAVMWAEQQRDSDGYFSTGSEPLSTDSYVLSAPDLDINLAGPDVLYQQDTSECARTAMDSFLVRPQSPPAPVCAS